MLSRNLRSTPPHSPGHRTISHHSVVTGEPVGASDVNTRVVSCHVQLCRYEDERRMEENGGEDEVKK